MGGFGSGRSEYGFFSTRPEKEESEVISATELYQEDKLKRGRGISTLIMKYTMRRFHTVFLSNGRSVTSEASGPGSNVLA